MADRTIEEIIESTREEDQDKVDWTDVWSKRYPILKRYQDEVDVRRYARQINGLLHDLEKEYGYSEMDAMLVLKDILYREYKGHR